MVNILILIFIKPYVFFYWDSIRGRENIDLGKDGGFHGINDVGEAVRYNGYDPPGGLIWNSTNGEVKVVPIFPHAINNSGYVTGWIRDFPGGGSMAVVWDDTNGIQAIAGGIHGYGWDINDYGKVVGMFGSPLNAFIGDESNDFIIIPTLGGSDGEAKGINNLGQVVGKSRTSTEYHAFLWDETSGIQDLGTLGYRIVGTDGSEAFDVNINGEVVGISNSPSSSDNTTGWGGWVAFIWDETHGMRDLNRLIRPDTGWILGTAFAINNQGQIVGYGGFNGEEHAYLLTPIPPELVSIDIKPGSETNCLNINGHGVIPVAILGSADFDVTNINGDSLLFNGSSVQVRGKKEKTMCHYEDVSRDFTYPEGVPDGHLDLVCQFEDDPSQWVPGQAEATLTGELIDGTPIEGTDSICIVP